MRVILGLTVVGSIAGVGWWIGGVMSPGAMELMLGVVLGTMAGIPALLIAHSSKKCLIVEHHHYYHSASNPSILVVRNPGKALIGKRELIGG